MILYNTNVIHSNFRCQTLHDGLLESKEIEEMRRSKRDLQDFQIQNIIEYVTLPGVVNGENKNSDLTSDDMFHVIKPDTRLVRKEIRTLTTEERAKYFSAINKLKAQLFEGISKYDILIVYHTPEYAPTAHFCPTFFPYHREYLKNFEVAIK